MISNAERYKVRSQEDLVEQVEKLGLIGDTLKAVHNNDDDFNYELIEGHLAFSDGVVFFVDTTEELAEGNQRDPHAFPLGIVDTAPFKADYEKHSDCYDYLLCRHGERYWLSVIRHDPKENGASRFMENALAVIREYLGAIGANSLRDIERMNAKARQVVRDREKERLSLPVVHRLPPRPATEVINIVK